MREKTNRPGRKSKCIVSESLKECLLNANHIGTGIPYRVIILDKVLYIWATSSANAVRMAAYHLGAKAIRVSPQEMVDVLKSE